MADQLLSQGCRSRMGDCARHASARHLRLCAGCGGGGDDRRMLSGLALTTPARIAGDVPSRCSTPGGVRCAAASERVKVAQWRVSPIHTIGLAPCSGRAARSGADIEDCCNVIRRREDGHWQD